MEENEHLLFNETEDRGGGNHFQNELTTFSQFSELKGKTVNFLSTLMLTLGLLISSGNLTLQSPTPKYMLCYMNMMGIILNLLTLAYLHYVLDSNKEKTDIAYVSLNKKLMLSVTFLMCLIVCSNLLIIFLADLNII